MKIIGIHSLTHDSGVCLCINGDIKYAVEEERLSRIKHHPGIEVEGKPPMLSIDWILKEANLNINEIDKFVHVGWEGDNFMKLDLIRTRFREFAYNLDPTKTKTSFVSHHKAHAASTFYASGFDKAIVLAIDGAGDWTSTSLYIGEGKKLEKIDEYPLDQSLGFMYSRAAKLLGLGNFGFGEGKMTALAGYGSSIVDFPPIIGLDKGRYSIVKGYFDNFKKYKRTNGILLQKHKDFAYVVQDALEEAVVNMLQSAHIKYGVSKFALAGGVALNCRMNGRINNLPWVKELFIQPGANDSGLCIGASYLGAIELNDPISKMSTTYLGPSIDSAEIEDYIKRNGLTAEKLNYPAKTGAKIIANGDSLAWMQGKLEFGPRALGHRSLLGDPRAIKNKDKLNFIKQRENWRPVAPSIIYSKKTYCDLSKSSDFMTKAIPMNNLAVNEIPAALHVDNTARVQVVRNKQDSFYELIKHFESITGVPAVLNTSLNAKGEPICNSIDDGIKFFYTTPTDYLIIDDWLIKK